MRSVKSLIAAGAASLLSSAAFAADMPIAPPPMYAPPLGRGFRRLVSARRYRLQQSARQVSQQRVLDRRNRVASTRHAASTRAGIFGLGVGYQVQQLVPRRHHRRVSRQRATSTASTSSPSNGGTSATDNYQRQQVRMAGSRQRLCRSRHLVVHHAVHRRRRRHVAQHHRRTSSTGQHAPTCSASPSFASRRQRSKWNFAWALHAGLAYKVSPEHDLRARLPLRQSRRRRHRRTLRLRPASAQARTRCTSRTSPRMT